MKKIAVVGLGIIGASICRALAKAGYFVAGDDTDEATLAYALEQGYIAEKVTRLSDHDGVFLAVPPRAAVEILQHGDFKPNAFVADICGVKLALEQAVYAAPRCYRYVGLHPMAGKETSGIRSSSAELFVGANLILTVSPNTPQSAIDEAKEYAKAMKFGRITECSAEEHDKKIALTSQLAHIVSNAYVKSPQTEGCGGFTGGSFQDMTRIAGVDEKMWTQLYMSNRENLLAELKGLISRLQAYETALDEQDGETLAFLLKEGREQREKVKISAHRHFGAKKF